jgi:8-oxo-(d)GTP phosphatase
VIVVRHAWAGDRACWFGSDRDRPLDARGRRQAERLVQTLGGFELARVLSSPYIRCVQTVEQLASDRGLTVELWEELGEERQVPEGVDLVRSLAGEPVAACVHGGLTEAIFGPEWGLKKGAALVLEAGPRPVAQLPSAA